MEENCITPAKKQKVEDTVSNESEPLQSSFSTLEKDGASQSADGGCYLMEKDTEYIHATRLLCHPLIKVELKANPSPAYTRLF